ncbi:MAG: 3-phosphoshikimate 1-carboxyvinyltransferase [Bacteroidetes bacterium HGW-Bacteroidetes-1]|jgi:3-phosphoshikimate 1-carboxyvinyltransferase|nr:MAG: 3-phosphoshikimate 1-carboxyvinyltransferase [Bacteroidetes bacterium HGW-Bacteroidetes-1]
MKIKVNNISFKAQVNLPGSKSISNRALMIRAYSGLNIIINGLSEADDTVMLERNLEMIAKSNDLSNLLLIDCGNAGTVFRFLLTYLASTSGKWILTGSARMKSRPVGDLVNSLRQLGADIQYVDNEGYPPLRIYGKPLKGGKTSVSMEKSSQFASSILMAGPIWHEGVSLDLTDNLSSLPYLEMTLQMMEGFGAIIGRSYRYVAVLPIQYSETDITIEPDWSAAAFWYELVALSAGGELLLKNLEFDSLQGDRKMKEMFVSLGVESFQEPDGVLIFKTGNVSSKLTFDLTNYPDMLPSLVATCCGLGVGATFSGLENLKYKESDRTAALHQQMMKIGCLFEQQSEGVYQLRPSKNTLNHTEELISFETYGDHRMAMAFAPLALKLGSVDIEAPEVVEKSYPDYWKELFSTQIIQKINL